tara:strand:- start:1534 stop:2649 length:1116 start_codon:yes stop_codon:yes gene_type:complete
LKKILIFTGSRADYGLLEPIIKLLKSEFFLDIAICNMHLSKKFGSTLNEIKIKDFRNIFYIRNLPSGQTNLHVLDSVSYGINKFSKCLKKSRPDLAIILGDRYEMLSASIACFFSKIKIMHINGGEITTGSLDDNIRNSITMFSDFHCPPTKKTSLRIKSMLPDNQYIINTGALGAYNAYKSKFQKKIYFQKKYKINFTNKNVLITIHPEKSFDKKLIPVKKLLKSLKQFDYVTKIFTASNSDAFGLGINNLINEFCKKNTNSKFIKSFGSDDYLSILKHMDCVIGNSSSGIIEAPVIKLPTLNLGNRQNGREFCKSIISADFCEEIIVKKLNNILFKKKNKLNFYSPYFKKNTPKIIFNMIEKLSLIYKK